MKNLVDFLNEHLESISSLQLNENETITDEKSFREYAEAKLKEIHGEDYNEEEAKEMIDGILSDYADDVKTGDWGKLVGVLNKGVVK